MKKISFPKKYKYGIKAPIKSHTFIFFNDFFFISKKITRAGSSAFQKKITMTRSDQQVQFISKSCEKIGNYLKFRNSEKATQIWVIFHFVLTLLSRGWIHILWPSYNIYTLHG